MSWESDVSFEFPYEVDSHLKEVRKREIRLWSSALPAVKQAVLFIGAFTSPMNSNSSHSDRGLSRQVYKEN